MSSLTLEQAKQVHALALLFNPLAWWTVEYDKKFNSMEDYHKWKQPLPFGTYGRPDMKGWGNWYDFSTKEIADSFSDALKEMGIESFYSETVSHTIFINW